MSLGSGMDSPARTRNLHKFLMHSAPPLPTIAGKLQHREASMRRQSVGAIGLLFVVAVTTIACTRPGQPPAQPPEKEEAKAPAKPFDRVLPGLRKDGFVQLPNQWSLKPAGRHIEVGDFPVN